MRKLILFVLIFVIFSSPLHALDFIAGAKAGYFTWRPYFKDIDTEFFQTIEKGDGVLYGPVLSLLFTKDISFSMAGLYGIQSANWSYRDHWDGANYLSGVYFINSTRVDFDTALSYRVFQSLKVFVGYKYQSIENVMMQEERKSDDLNDINIHVNESKINMDVLSHGPALGIGYSKTFAKIFFITANFSTLYMFGTFKADQILYEYDGTSPKQSGSGNLMNDKTKHIGINFEPSVGISVENRIIVTIGGRYQWLRTEIDTDVKVAQGPLNDYLYGVFFSVLFVF